MLKHLPRFEGRYSRILYQEHERWGVSEQSQSDVLGAIRPRDLVWAHYNLLHYDRSTRGIGENVQGRTERQCLTETQLCATSLKDVVGSGVMMSALSARFPPMTLV